MEETSASRSPEGTLCHMGVATLVVLIERYIVASYLHATVLPCDCFMYLHGIAMMGTFRYRTAFHPHSSTISDLYFNGDEGGGHACCVTYWSRERPGINGPGPTVASDNATRAG